MRKTEQTQIEISAYSPDEVRKIAHERAKVSAKAGICELFGNNIPDDLKVLTICIEDIDLKDDLPAHMLPVNAGWQSVHIS